jgi:hypothetical protein
VCVAVLVVGRATRASFWGFRMDGMEEEVPSMVVRSRLGARGAGGGMAGSCSGASALCGAAGCGAVVGLGSASFVGGLLGTCVWATRRLVWPARVRRPAAPFSMLSVGWAGASCIAGGDGGGCGVEVGEGIAWSAETAGGGAEVMTLAVVWMHGSGSVFGGAGGGGAADEGGCWVAPAEAGGGGAEDLLVALLVGSVRTYSWYGSSWVPEGGGGPSAPWCTAMALMRALRVLPSCTFWNTACTLCCPSTTLV